MRVTDSDFRVPDQNKKGGDMPNQNMEHISAWKALTKQADAMKHPENHLKHLIKEKDRLENFSRRDAGLFFDFSRQRIN